MSASTTQGFCMNVARRLSSKAGLPAYALLPLFEQALRAFAEAEKVRPLGNDDAILRWNRCVRLLQTDAYVPDAREQERASFDDQDTPPT